MKLFIDTADIEEAQRATALGVISGATTNPKLAAAAEPGNFAARVKEILGWRSCKRNFRVAFPQKQF